MAESSGIHSNQKQFQTIGGEKHAENIQKPQKNNDPVQELAADVFSNINENQTQTGTSLSSKTAQIDPETEISEKVNETVEGQLFPPDFEIELTDQELESLISDSEIQDILQDKIDELSESGDLEDLINSLNQETSSVGEPLADSYNFSFLPEENSTVSQKIFAASDIEEKTIPLISISKILNIKDRITNIELEDVLYAYPSKQAEKKELKFFDLIDINENKSEKIAKLLQERRLLIFDKKNKIKIINKDHTLSADNLNDFKFVPHKTASAKLKDTFQEGNFADYETITLSHDDFSSLQELIQAQIDRKIFEQQQKFSEEKKTDRPDQSKEKRTAVNLRTTNVKELLKGEEKKIIKGILVQILRSFYEQETSRRAAEKVRSIDQEKRRILKEKLKKIHIETEKHEIETENIIDKKRDMNKEHREQRRKGEQGL